MNLVMGSKSTLRRSYLPVERASTIDLLTASDVEAEPRGAHSMLFASLVP